MQLGMAEGAGPVAVEMRQVSDVIQVFVDCLIISLGDFKKDFVLVVSCFQETAGNQQALMGFRQLEDEIRFSSAEAIVESAGSLVHGLF